MSCVPAQARIAVDHLEFVIGPESAVIIGRLAPRHVDCGGNVAAALGLLLRQVGGGEGGPRIRQELRTSTRLLVPIAATTSSRNAGCRGWAPSPCSSWLVG